MFGVNLQTFSQCAYVAGLYSVIDISQCKMLSVNVIDNINVGGFPIKIGTQISKLIRVSIFRKSTS